ncbi:hypothetical protein EYD45_08090 [Hyunsoonleella flava]|uniref:Uncharacterized protein n=1 Tax=Hyunsoonleella flava TaxID=2527939 RepID=A0A4Q9FE95_9FLAO|nr:hypothetical protein [Hyunsoonleella flava]TBN03965.1 hypothetical protein EYD45_08090 [Hyunsoonleella flava]
MKSLPLLLFSFLIILCRTSFAQGNIDDCQTKLSIFHEYVKAKNYDAAYEPWAFVKNNCPDLSIAIYIDGEKILKNKIENAKGNEKRKFIEELIEVLQKRLKYFENKTHKGKYLAKICQLRFDNRDILQKDIKDLYDCFDAAYIEDKSTFTHPKSLYTYFSLIVDLYHNGERPIEDVFDKYDDILEKIEEEIKNYSEKLNKLIQKEDGGTKLTKKEVQRKNVYQDYLKNYDLISKSIDVKLGVIADCENLIPLYNKNFEANKDDAIWLKRAVSRMYNKECTEDALYEKLVKAYDDVAPSAETKIYIVTILIKKGGNPAEINRYLDEAYKLETDAYKKSKIAYKIGLILKKKGSYARARSYFRNALKLNPSNGRPHLAIAAMYAESAKNCGDTNFNKRAVYWLAAIEARKALRVDPTLEKAATQNIKRYEALAPSREDIFKCACFGKIIKIDCWINGKVTVPNIKKR